MAMVTSPRFVLSIAAAALLEGCALFGGSSMPGGAGLEAGLVEAKRELDAGRRACAFARTEAVRRSTDQTSFHLAFEVVFLGRPRFDPSPKAEEALRQQLAAQPADAAIALRLADIYISRSDWAKAEPLVKQAMALRPDDVEPVAMLARMREHQHDDAGAKSLVVAFAKAHPTSTEGILLLLPEAHGPARRAALEAAVKDHPGDGELAFNLAAEVNASGDTTAAEPVFVRAAALAPKSATVQAWAGRFFLKAASKPAEALDYYFRAYFLEPDYYETEYVESRIARLARDELARCPAP